VLFRSRGSGITIDNYTINGFENARYGLRVITNPVSGAESIGIVDDVLIGTGRIKNCDWYGDVDSLSIPGIGLQITGAPTNVVVDGCNALDNPVNLVERNSSFHSFPTVVFDSLGVNPTRYIEGWNPGTIAPSGQEVLIIPAPGITYGDFIERVSFGMFINDNIISYAQASVDNIVVRLENRGSVAATVVSGVVTVDVNKKY
jgi:hypothetical protein